MGCSSSKQAEAVSVPAPISAPVAAPAPVAVVAPPPAEDLSGKTPQQIVLSAIPSAAEKTPSPVPLALKTASSPNNPASRGALPQRGSTSPRFTSQRFDPNGPVKDMSPVELCNALSAHRAKNTEKEDGEQEEEEEEEEEEDEEEEQSTMQFVKKFVLALIPTPDNLADALSEKTVG